MVTVVITILWLLLLALVLWGLVVALLGIGGGDSDAGAALEDTSWTEPRPDPVKVERARRGRNRAHSLGRRGDPNDLAPWDRL